jgi:hypothetical protein
MSFLLTLTRDLREEVKYDKIMEPSADGNVENGYYLIKALVQIMTLTWGKLCRYLDSTRKIIAW